MANDVFRPYDNETNDVKKKRGDEIKFSRKNLTNSITYLILHEIQFFTILNGYQLNCLIMKFFIHF